MGKNGSSKMSNNWVSGSNSLENSRRVLERNESERKQNELIREGTNILKQL